MTVERLAPQRDGRVRRSCAAVPFLCFLLTQVNAWAQPVPNPQGEKPTFRVSSQMVLLNVHVTNPSGVPISGLGAEDFLVLEDDVPQAVAFFEEPSTAEPAPASLLLLIDTSSSMTSDDMEDVRRAALDFIEQVAAENEIALAAFDEALYPVCDFTRDRALLEEGVGRLSPSGGTALYDALFEAVELLESSGHPRAALVLFTDGKDLDSRRSFEELEGRLRASGVVVYVVGRYADASRRLYMTGEKYFKPPDLEVNLNPVWALSRLAELTGGRALFPARMEPISAFLTMPLKDWARAYVLGYRPSESGGATSRRWRDVSVRLAPARFQPGSYLVRTRRGYVR